MARESREVWSKRVERWRASGLTIDEFAAEIGVNGNSLRHWSWLLGREERVRGSAAAQAGRPRDVAFVEVVASSGSKGPSAEAIELVVRNDIRIRVPAAFDADLLRRVIAAVEGR